MAKNKNDQATKDAAEEKDDKQTASAKEDTNGAAGEEQEAAADEAAPEASEDAAQNGAADDDEAADEAADEEAAAEEAVDVPADPIAVDLEFQTYPADTYAHDDLDLSDEDVIEMYRSMMLQRRFEERCRQMYQQQKISGFLHLYIGQEAVSTGSVAAIRLGEDSVITAYRDHGLGLAMGISPEAGMAELFGKVTGCSKGKGGSMHFFSKEQRMFGGHGIVGAHIPVAAGIAFAHKYRGEDEVCLCFFGDGAVQQGAFHEAANLAGLYDLPLVMICENNMYGMGTSIDRAAAEPDLYRQATGYDIPGALVNGMDVFSVKKAVQDHVDMAREGQPSLLEIRTYRYQGHSISDPAKYRAEGELDERKSQDPIVRLQRYITDEGLADDDALDEIDEEMKQTVLDAIDFAEESDLPEKEAIYEDIYAQKDYPFIK